MRRQVSLLVAVISTAIVASFVIPLLLMVSTLAADRGMAVASQQANSVAMVVSSLHDEPQMAAALHSTLVGSAAVTTVVLTDGNMVGAAWPGFATDAAYSRAHSGQAFSVQDSSGGAVYVPVLVDSGVVVVRATMTPAQLSDGVGLAWVSIVALGVLLSGLAIFAADQVGRGVSRPLLSVAATAHRLREGDLDARAALEGPSETVELGSALNGLADRIGQLLAAERDSVRGLAHRLRTPVTALRLEAEQVADPQVRGELAELVDQLQVTIDGVVQEARRPLREDLPAACDAAAVVAARVDYWRPLAEDQGRVVDVELPNHPVRVPLSALELTDVVDICIDNIFAHTGEEVGFEVALSREGGRAALVISDRGEGFPERPSEPRHGTSGLGLKIARRTVEGAHGVLTTSSPGVPGASVRIELPLVQTSAH